MEVIFHKQNHAVATVGSSILGEVLYVCWKLERRTAEVSSLVSKVLRQAAQTPFFSVTPVSEVFVSRVNAAGQANITAR